MTPNAKLPGRARPYVASVVTLGAAAVVAAWRMGPPPLEVGALLFVLLAVAGGAVKVPLPVAGQLSLAYAFVVATFLGFGLGASTLAAVLSAIVSGRIARAGATRLPLHKTAFNAGALGLSAFLAGLGYLAANGAIGTIALPRDLWPVAVYTLVFSLVNVGLISAAIHLSGTGRAESALAANFRWTVPGYVAGSALATLLVVLQADVDPWLLVLGAPFAYLLHVSFRSRGEKLEEERRHARETAELYTSITEALALAIEAKDENTEEHLRRVREFSLGIAEILGLSAAQTEALRAAALLHDIGKIAVPEYILNKPGRLTDEEMKIMRVHPGTGADILERVPFPYPLAPIVRHHHERWDGTGYPDGLAGERIPLGARILTAVDCYDALTSDRPYRKALPRAEALEFLKRQSGEMFDPAIVAVLVRHVDALECRVTRTPALEAVGDAPERTPDRADACGEPAAAGRATELDPREGELASLSAVLANLDRQLDLTDRLALISSRVSAVVPYRSLVVYLFDESRQNLVAHFATGQGATRLRGLVIPVGERLSGWAALHQRPYGGQTHRNPLERDGSRSDLEELYADPELADLRSAAVAPLSTPDARIGVLALYHADFEYADADLHRLGRIADHVAREVARASLAFA